MLSLVRFVFAALYVSLIFSAIVRSAHAEPTLSVSEGQANVCLSVHLDRALERYVRALRKLESTATPSAFDQLEERLAGGEFMRVGYLFHMINGPRANENPVFVAWRERFPELLEPPRSDLVPVQIMVAGVLAPPRDPKAFIVKRYLGKDGLCQRFLFYTPVVNSLRRSAHSSPRPEDAFESRPALLALYQRS